MVAQYSPKEPKYRMFICPSNTCWEKLRETFPLGVPVVKPYPNTKVPGYKMMHLKIDIPCLNQEQFQILSDFFELNPSSEAPAMYWTAMKIVGWCIPEELCASVAGQGNTGTQMDEEDYNKMLDWIKAVYLKQQAENN